jgi:hypothetical protein
MRRVVPIQASTAATTGAQDVGSGTDPVAPAKFVGELTAVPEVCGSTVKLIVNEFVPSVGSEP